MLINLFQEDSLYDFRREQNEADQNVVLCIDLLGFFKNVCSFCHAVVIGDLSALGWEVGYRVLSESQEERQGNK